MTFALGKFARFLPAATFSMVAEFLMGLSDSVICGHVIGEDGLSVVNLMQPAMNVVSFFALLVGTGASVLYSLEMGRFDKRRAGEMFTQGLWCALLFGGLLLAALAVARVPAAESFGVSGAVLDGVKEYWLWFLPCALLEVVAFFLVSMCYADGDSKTCAYAYVMQLIGNCLFSVPLTMYYGFAGCALGTSLGHLLAVATLLFHFHMPGNSLRLVHHFSLHDAFRICTCAAGDASIRLCNAGLVLALNLYVTARFGAERLPVLAVAVMVLGLSEAFDGVATAAQPLASVYIGERNDLLVRRIMRYATFVSVVEGLAITILLTAFPSIVVMTVGIKDPALASSAATAARIVSMSLLGLSLVMLLNSYYTFIVREDLALSITVLAMFAVPVALFPVAGHFLGEKGVWAALAVGPYVAIAAIAAFVAKKWGRKAFPLFLDRQRMDRMHVFDVVLNKESICAIAKTINDTLVSVGGIGGRRAGLSSLLVEESLMVVLDHNEGRRIMAELTLDLNDGIKIVIRDDGEIFDITDADARICSLRAYLVSTLMTAIPTKRNMTTTGFNRNAFKI